jgi:hypothetical protein
MNCEICYEKIKNKFVTECNHTFCKKCIEKWCENYNNNCPKCRKEFTFKDIDNIKKVLSILKCENILSDNKFLTSINKFNKNNNNDLEDFSNILIGFGIESVVDELIKKHTK